MRRKMQFHIVSALLIISMLLPNKAQACECTIPRYMREWEVADAIFLGLLIDSQARLTNENVEYVSYKFQIYRVWKGEYVSQIQVQSRLSSAYCGSFFSRDRAYIVFAYETDIGLETHQCTLTHPAESMSIYKWIFANTNWRIRQGFGFSRTLWE
jgi:hypothetical protein